jgi:hypothetical protein
MSHFTTIESEFDIDHLEEMMAALKDAFRQGDTEPEIEYHAKGADMYGYQGDNRSKIDPKSSDYSPPCEVIIRRKYVGRSSNDIGFKLQPNGKFRAIVSEFDRNRFSMQTQHKVQQDYSIAVGEKTLKAKGFTEIERIKMDDGSIKLIGNQPKVSVGTVKIKNW